MRFDLFLYMHVHIYVYNSFFGSLFEILPLMTLNKQLHFDLTLFLGCFFDLQLMMCDKFWIFLFQQSKW